MRLTKEQHDRLVERIVAMGDKPAKESLAAFDHNLTRLGPALRDGRLSTALVEALAARNENKNDSFGTIRRDEL